MLENVEVQKPTITIDDFTKVELIVGEILSCEMVEGSQRLYKLSVDFGPGGKRQILSGIRQFVPIDKLMGKQAIFVFNLAPRKMMGMVSEGMLLCAQDNEGNFEITTISGRVANGTRLK